MTKSHLLAALAAGILLLGLIAAYGIAQQPAAPPVAAPARGAPVSMGGVALLDVNYVFKKHARFKALMDEMKANVQMAEARVKRDRETLRKLAEQLEQYQNGSDQYKRKEEEMAKLQADVGVRVQLEKKDFLQREAKIYHSVYQEIAQHVRYYSQTNGISMVLRFNGDPSDVNKPDTVIREINKQVVWYAGHLDITPVILARVNQSNPAPPPGPISRGGHTVPFNR